MSQKRSSSLGGLRVFRRRSSEMLNRNSMIDSSSTSEKNEPTKRVKERPRKGISETIHRHSKPKLRSPWHLSSSPQRPTGPLSQTSNEDEASIPTLPDLDLDSFRDVDLPGYMFATNSSQSENGIQDSLSTTSSISHSPASPTKPLSPLLGTISPGTLSPTRETRDITLSTQTYKNTSSAISGQSMANRGRSSYRPAVPVGPRRKDPIPYNVLVIGAKNCGKTSFAKFLHSSLGVAPSSKSSHAKASSPLQSPLLQTSADSSSFKSLYAETETENGERLGVTVWDSQGLQSQFVDLQLREIVRFLEDKFEARFNRETRIVRAPGIAGESIIHCVFLVLDPARLDANMATAAAKIKAAATKTREEQDPAESKTHSQQQLGALSEYDLMVLRVISRCSTVIPIIGKADTVTQMHMEYLKKAVRISLDKAGINVLEKLPSSDEEYEDEDRKDDVDPDEENEQVENPDADKTRNKEGASGNNGPGSPGARAPENRESNSVDRTDPTRATNSSTDEYTSLTSNTADGSGKSHSRTGSKTNCPESATEHQNEDTPEENSEKLAPKVSSVEDNISGKEDHEVFKNIKNTNECNGIPMSVLSPDPHTLLPHGEGDSSPKLPVGRHFPWGFADPNNPSHCDFTRLKVSIFDEWRQDIITVCREVWYERWRTLRLDFSRHQHGPKDAGTKRAQSAVAPGNWRTR